ncbi:MAG: hypothetical protein ACLSFT_09495 [Ruminococcus callidus]
MEKLFIFADTDGVERVARHRGCERCWYSRNSMPAVWGGCWLSCCGGRGTPALPLPPETGLLVMCQRKIPMDKLLALRTPASSFPTRRCDTTNQN